MMSVESIVMGTCFVLILIIVIINAFITSIKKIKYWLLILGILVPVMFLCVYTTNCTVYGNCNALATIYAVLTVIFTFVYIGLFVYKLVKIKKCKEEESSINPNNKPVVSEINQDDIPLHSSVYQEELYNIKTKDTSETLREKLDKLYLSKNSQYSQYES